MLRKFRGKTLRLDRKKKTKGADDAPLPTAVPAPYCRSCGQRTPNQRTFSTLSSSSTTTTTSAACRDADRSPWAPAPGYARSDSGYGSGSQASGSQAGDSVVSIPAGPPARRGTYSSSVYSRGSEDDDEDEDEDEPARGRGAVAPPPVVVQGCDDGDDHEFDLPPRTLSTYSARFTPPSRSRYARLNELPAASPRSLLFPEDLYDLDAGIERGEGKEAPGRRRGRWHKGALSLSRLSIGNLRKS